jgi:GNAT superfamily N-acetyltransferase
MMNVTFVPSQRDDAAKLVDLQIRAFHDDARLYPGVALGGPPGYDSIDWTLTDIAESLCHNIVCDGEIVGGIVIFDRGEGHYHLDKIYLDPAYHNRGIGTLAMRFMEKTYPAKKWTLDTPKYAVRNHHFYEKFGYVKIDEIAAHGLILFAYEKLMD